MEFDRAEPVGDPTDQSDRLLGAGLRALSTREAVVELNPGDLFAQRVEDVARGFSGVVESVELDAAHRGLQECSVYGGSVRQACSKVAR